MKNEKNMKQKINKPKDMKNTTKKTLHKIATPQIISTGSELFWKILHKNVPPH